MPPSPPLHPLPKDSIAGALVRAGSSWWENSPGDLCRGRLIWGFGPLFHIKPLLLQEQGRTSATDHTGATLKLVPLRAGVPPSAARVPVAGLPRIKGEVRAVYRAKRRPMLVLSMGGPDLPGTFRIGSAWQGHKYALAAPFFGGDQDGTRAGWPEPFVERIRRGEYPHCSYDQLPILGTSFSILRLDLLQPVFHEAEHYELTPWKLSEDALDVMDSWVQWLVTGELDPESMLETLRQEVTQLSAAMT